MHALRAAGLRSRRATAVATRLDRDLGKHGDTGGAELAQLARVRAGELDACVVSSVTLDAVGRLGDATDLVTVWDLAAVPPLLLHGARRDDPRARRASRALLFAMDASDPKLCEPMELEYVNRWVPFDPIGLRDSDRRRRAGPVIVGATEVAA